MAARAIWKGQITFGTVTVPVKLYSAVQDKSIRFRLLDRKSREPVKQHMVDPESGEVVDHGSIRRAYQAEDGKLVVLEPEELEKIEPPESRDIEITRFVAPEKINHQWYERPYYLGPDDKGGQSYFTLAAAMREGEVEGVARWVMRRKSYVGALRAEGDYLMLISLRHAGEVVSASALDAPGGRALGKKEVDMAKQLVASMEGELDIDAFRDEYRERVIEYAAAKAAGKVKKLPAPKAKKADKSLEDVLEKSLAAAGKRKSA
jgi:DNA end-binding protein Ku